MYNNSTQDLQFDLPMMVSSICPMIVSNKQSDLLDLISKYQHISN